VKKSKRRKAELQLREAEFLHALPAEWLGPWASPEIRWLFRRGMPERLTVTAGGNFLDAGGRQLRFDDQGGLRFPDQFDYHYRQLWFGSYRLFFTYARVLVTMEIWREEVSWMPAQERWFQGELRRTANGMGLLVQEQTERGKPLGEPLILTFSSQEY
jgi:hypothetical protein